MLGADPSTSRSQPDDRASRGRGGQPCQASLPGDQSHELRTPLNAILVLRECMMTETFGPAGSPNYRDYSRDIHDSGCASAARHQRRADSRRWKPAASTQSRGHDRRGNSRCRAALLPRTQQAGPPQRLPRIEPNLPTLLWEDAGSCASASSSRVERHQVHAVGRVRHRQRAQRARRLDCHRGLRQRHRHRRSGHSARPDALIQADNAYVRNQEGSWPRPAASSSPSRNCTTGTFEITDALGLAPP